MSTETENRDALLPAVLGSALPDVRDWFSGAGDSWVLVDQMSGSSLYQTHYFCRSCCADLTDLRVHHVRWCPYCGVEMSFLLDGEERHHAKFDGRVWPYDLLRERFPSWCSWRGSGDEPRIPMPDGGWSQRLTVCRLLEGHDGEHEYVTGRERPPRNPIRGVE